MSWGITMTPVFLGEKAVFLLAIALMACGVARGPGDPADRPYARVPGSPPDWLAIDTMAPGPWGLSADKSASVESGWAETSGGVRGSSPTAVGQASYCEAKFGHHAVALNGCQRYAHESFRKLEPAFRRARADSMAMESKLLEGCVRRHDGRLGVDWMLVEHCFSKGNR